MMTIHRLSIQHNTLNTDRMDNDEWWVLRWWDNSSVRSDDERMSIDHWIACAFLKLHKSFSDLWIHFHFNSSQIFSFQCPPIFILSLTSLFFPIIFVLFLIYFFKILSKTNLIIPHMVDIFLTFFLRFSTVSDSNSCSFVFSLNIFATKYHNIVGATEMKISDLFNQALRRCSLENSISFLLLPN